MRSSMLLALVLFASLCGLSHAKTSYDLDYHIRFEPKSGLAHVSITYAPDDGRLKEATFRIDSSYAHFKGDGQITATDDFVRWQPPKKGGTLHYQHRVNHKRSKRGYDARMNDDWVIVRGDDLIPRAKVRISKGADARARLRFTLPKHWSTAYTPFLLDQHNDAYVITQAGRSFDRPVGWMIAGDIGGRGEKVDGFDFFVAGPKGEEVERNVVLAFINATYPEFEKAFGILPRKVLVVRAGDPMWRGGLSGPRSLFLHNDRPLISGNGTSTLVHELFHVITRIRGGKEDDWIAEGLAEYYSVELLQRSGLLSEKRAEKAFQWLKNHGKKVTSLRGKASKGKRTARAVTLFVALDHEIRTVTKQKASLDAVVKRLIGQGRIHHKQLEEAVTAVMGQPSTTLDDPVITGKSSL